MLLCVCILVIFNMKSVWKIVRLLVKNISRGFCLFSLSLSFSCCLRHRFCCSYIIFHSFGFRATYFFRGLYTFNLTPAPHMCTSPSPSILLILFQKVSIALRISSIKYSSTFYRTYSTYVCMSMCWQRVKRSYLYASPYSPILAKLSSLPAKGWTRNSWWSKGLMP